VNLLNSLCIYLPYKSTEGSSVSSKLCSPDVFKITQSYILNVAHVILNKMGPCHTHNISDHWWLKLNRAKEVENKRVTGLIITNYCGLSSLVKRDTVRLHCAPV
jgi:hypothetical protein